MVQEWFTKNYIIYLLAGLCGVGVLIKIITNLVYIRLVLASSHMASSKNKLIKEMKLKFETFYKLKIGVNNVDIFVDKYVYKHRLCGLLLSTWENISGLMLVMCLLIAPIAAILGLIVHCGQEEILYTFFTGVCTSALLILVDNLFNISSKRQLIKLNIKDYLENYLKARLEQEAENPEAFVQYRAEMAASVDKQLSSRMLKKEQKRLEKEQKERAKCLELEFKEKEREERRRAKVERREAENERREEERRAAQEERRRQAEAKAEEKRRIQEEKKEKERLRKEEKQKEEERQRLAAEEKAAKKRMSQEKKLEEKDKNLAEMKKQEDGRKQVANLQAVRMMQEAEQVRQEQKSSKNKKNVNQKLAKMQQRNERLKEEIQAQREQREKDRLEGKDPYETFSGTKSVDNPKNYHVNDFDMDYEMRVKAVEREEAKLREANAGMVHTNADQAVAATVQAEKTSSVQLKGNSPSEDKVIDDILRQFLA